ncbi:MAG: ferrous iron transport protein B [Thermoplasmatota archaeon]
MKKDTAPLVRAALAGNPNVGKTSLFNHLTGSNQKVGNWSGVTVEKLSGTMRSSAGEVEIVDLPGSYSLSGFSQDEIIAREYIVNERPDVVVQVIDSSNLERRLYLTVQLLEIGAPLLLVLTKTDITRSRGDRLETDLLSRTLEVPIHQCDLVKGTGIDDLKLSLATFKGQWKEAPKVVDYGHVTESIIERLLVVLKRSGHILGPYPKRWLATRLIEGDSDLVRRSRRSPIHKEIDELLDGLDHEELELDMADKRYDLASSLAKRVLISKPRKRTLSSMIDEVTTGRFTGIPFFLLIMWGMFELTFGLGRPLADLVDIGFGYLGELALDHISPGWLASLIGEGMIGGVGAVLVFLPNILILFLIISVLEGSGYMARAAFIMDRFMTKIGLSGRSFIPMVIGFGCNVPAIMAARTIENRKDRLITILVNPFISCSARLPVYILFTGIFFPETGGTVIFGLYLLGILVAVGSAKLFRMSILKGEPSPMIMELPDYRPPSMKDALKNTWEKGYLYARKAGTLILLGSILMWFLANYSLELSAVDYGSRSSIAGQLGVIVAPVIAPLGFDWKIGVALIFGFFAKEIVIGSLGVLYGGEAHSGSVTEGIANDPIFSPLSSLGLMVFVLLYMPCLATVAVIKQETGSWKWTLFSILYGTAVAYTAALLIYQGGLLIGLG